jgi:hypothetical protein
MIRLCAVLLYVVLRLAMKIGFDTGAAALGFIAEGIKRLRQRRMRKRRLKELGIPEEGAMGSWLQSRTIQGLAASGAAAVLGWFVLDADAATLGAQIAEWVLNGAQLAGLVYAARGRKLAQGPL